MDSLSSPRLSRRPKYESFPHPPHFPDPKYSPERPPPFHSFAPTPPAIPRNQFYEPWLLHSHGDLPYFPSGFDLRYLPSSPRTSDRFQPNGNLFELGRTDGALVSRRRMGAEQDRFLWEESEWKGRRPVRVSDERDSRYREPFIEQIPPFVSPRELHRHPPTSPRFFGRPISDPKVVKSSGAVPGNLQSQAVGNGTGNQRSHKKKSNGRAVPSERGFGGRKFSGLKSMKKSDPLSAVKEDGFRSSYHANISSMDKKHEFKEDCYAGKRKMVSTRVVKYNEDSVKRPMQKPSAFCRIQSGLSVWERLEEKPLILSPSCSLPSPRISVEGKAKGSIIEPTSFESNALAPKALDPFIAELSPIEKNLFIEKPARVIKKKNMIQIREKLIIPSVSSLAGSSRTTNNLVMKRKKKNMIQTREKVVIPIVCSPGSIAKQGVNRNSNANCLGSVSVLPQPNKAEASSRMPESKLMVNARTKKVKKLAANKMSGAEEAAKISSRVDGCIIKAPDLEDVMEIPEHEGAINCAKKTSYCIPNGDTETINESHLQIYQKNQTKQATPIDNISANIITTDVNQAQDIVAEILADRGEESLKLGEKLDSIGQGSFNFDVSVCSQSSEYIIDNLAANDAFMNMEENVASNSIKQIKSPKSPFSWKIKQDMPPPDITAVSPELLGAGEVFVSNALKCSSAQMEIEKEVKHQEKTVFITATKELEVPGDYASSESCIHAPEAPSFSEISNSAPEQKLHGKGAAKENNMIPQSVSDMNFPDGLGTFTIDFRGKKIGRALEPMEMGSPSTHFENVLQSHPLLSESMDFNEHGGSGNPELGSKGEAFVSSMVSNSLELEHESVKTIGNIQLMPEKAQLSPSPKHRKQVSPNPKLTDEEIFRIKRSPLSGVRRSLPNRPNFSASLKETARPNQTGRHRTWCRASTRTPSLQSDENLKLGGISSKQVPKKPGKIQNSSYFRKGNSLIRKLAAERSPVLPPTVDSSGRKFMYSTEGGRRVFRFGYPNSVAPSYPAFERSKTPPLPPPSKLSGFTMNSHSDLPQLIPMDRSPEPVTDQGNQHDTPSTNLVVCNSETNQDTASCKTVEIANGKRVIYVKRNLNQLVAAPRTEIGDSCKILTEKFQKPVHLPIKKSKKMPFSSSYLYYRSKRNQLIRNVTSSDSNLAGIPANNTNSVLQKAKKPSRSSLVWTLGGDKLSQKCITNSLCQSVFPYIFPWKRTANWKRFITANSTPISSRSSVSLISQKLQCLTKRNTIYKISTNGFSLRKAGVVGIGGSSLKWSKSIEKRSKKASEEATLAVAEVERKLRERKRSKSTCGNGKNKVSSSCRSISGIELKRGERIFRVGSARYKMDASMRTLLRIPDDHSSSPGNQQQGNRSRISFVPKRLIIGNNEYVQIGNGDQLVRDPKKLKRILANEKVRWSLHSARLRSAQKRQYCLFFTRFGKCNKSGRKCPYIHDPTKVAICTKFLKGHCSDTKCKLTHKVIPERMPDCSYFLRGLCTNINCPYRHVKVNVNAPLCDGFLRGHCADGDECRKKHSYTCPLFEATGKCPQGSLCKLHHPKIQTKSKKRKRIEIQSNNQGRYFYSGESLGVPSSQNDLAGGNGIFCSNGRLTEYINLDVDGDNFAIQNDESYTGKLDFGYLDFKSCDIDELIKPVRIMHSDDLPIF